MSPRGWRSFLIHAGIAVAYFLTAKLGFTLATVAEQVTVVWPPSGIALAACLLFGPRVWPGIWLGAFLANITSHEPFAVASAIATGNTLEALVGTWLLARVGGFDTRLGRLRDVLSFALLAAAGSTLVAATIGAASLCAGGLQPWSAFPSLARTWWLGDAMGILVVVPVCLAWTSSWRRSRWPPIRIAEALLLASGLVLVSLLAFRYSFTGFVTRYPLGYMVFPFLIWAAVRFGQLGTATTVLIASTTAIGSTVQGSGPFSGGSIGDSLFLVQTFLSVVALTTLLLGAAVAERKSSDARRSTEHRVTQAIASARSLEQAAPRILETICTQLEWDLGSLWSVDPEQDRLLCVEQWHAPGIEAPKFERLSREMKFERGIGLPGRVWAGARPFWIADVARDTNFPRAPVASGEGLHAAFGFPIVLDGTVVAVLEFFSREIRQPDGELIESFGAIGAELGQYIGRKRVEMELKEADRRKDEFLATLAHELRNPLAPARNAVEILRLKGSEDPEVEQARQILDRQVTRLTRLVDDLLDVARITTRKVKLERAEIEVATIVAWAVEASRPAIDSRRHELTVTVPDEPILVQGDLVRLSQALGNLLDNAAKYMDEGGEIALVVERRKERVELRVKDRGIGIPPDILPKIFDLFAQADRSLDRAGGGLGVGLSLVRQLVEMHGGALHAKSAGAGMGSEFVITLPVLDGK